MKERGILFSAPMVRKLLSGEKTQTRRIIKPEWSRCLDLEEDEEDRAKAVQGCPYGRPGDRLWVRETWRSWETHCPDNHDEDETCSEHCEQTYVAYAATPREGYRPKPDKARIVYLDETTPLESNPDLLGPWRPSIHMPRWASRITLEITGIRVERVRDISDADAEAEGVLGWAKSDAGLQMLREVGIATPTRPSFLFKLLWIQINGAESWDSSPSVWAISFKPVEEPARRTGKGVG